MKDLRMSNALVFVLLASIASFCGAQAETNIEGMVDTVDQQVSLKDQGFASRVYAKAQRIVTGPVNCVFGQEDSFAKKSFYVVVAGGVIMAIAGYGSYRYYYAYLMRQAKEHQEQAEVQKVEKLTQQADVAKQAKIEAQTERDLKQYKSIMANRMNAQADYRAAEVKLQNLEHEWDTNGRYRHSRYTDTYGRNPYYEAEVAYHKERADLLSKITDLGKRWSNLTQQEAQFERDHGYISRERFKEVEEWALGMFHRWGRVVIA